MIERLVMEQAVLSALMASPGRWWMELQDLSPQWFADPVHRQIASAIIRLRDRHRRIHWTRVCRVLGWSEKSRMWRVRRGQRDLRLGPLEALARGLGTESGTDALVVILRTKKPEGN